MCTIGEIVSERGDESSDGCRGLCIGSVWKAEEGVLLLVPVEVSVTPVKEKSVACHSISIGIKSIATAVVGLSVPEGSSGWRKTGNILCFGCKDPWIGKMHI